MTSSVVIGAYNDDLEASKSPEVSSESSKSDYIMASPIFCVKHIELYLILWKLVVSV